MIRWNIRQVLFLGTCLSEEKGGTHMTVAECIETRRSIRRYRPDPIDHSLLESIVALASYSPTWKNTQITRYTAIEDPSLLKEIADRYTPEYNANIIRQTPVLMAVTFIKGRCGFERDGSFTTKKGDRWQMFDVGVSCQTFCLAAKDKGLGTVIMGVLTKTGFQICYIFRRSRSSAH